MRVGRFRRQLGPLHTPRRLEIPYNATRAVNGFPRAKHQHARRTRGLAASCSRNRVCQGDGCRARSLSFVRFVWALELACTPSPSPIASPPRHVALVAQRRAMCNRLPTREAPSGVSEALICSIFCSCMFSSTAPAPSNSLPSHAHSNPTSSSVCHAWFPTRHAPACALEAFVCCVC